MGSLVSSVTLWMLLAEDTGVFMMTMGPVASILLSISFGNVGMWQLPALPCSLAVHLYSLFSLFIFIALSSNPT